MASLRDRMYGRGTGEEAEPVRSLAERMYPEGIPDSGVDMDTVPPLSGLGDFLERGTEAIPGIGKGIRRIRRETLKPAAKALREKVRKPLGSAIEEMLATEFPSARGAAGIPGMLANVGTRFAGQVAASATELPIEIASQLVESAPEEIALGGIGRASKALGVTQGLKTRLIEPLDELLALKTKGRFTLAHRGGLLPDSKSTLDVFDRAEVRAASEAEDIASVLTLNPDGSAITTKNQQFLGQLLEQPEQRALLRELNATDQVINVADESYTVSSELLGGAARPVPGVIPDSASRGLREAGLSEADIPIIRRALEPRQGGTVGSMLDEIIESPGFNKPREGRKVLKGVLEATAAEATPRRILAGMQRLSPELLDDIVTGRFRPQHGDLIIPEVDAPVTTLADIAEKVAKMQGKNIEDIAAAMKADVSSITRMVDENFNPRRYAAARVGVWDTLSKAFRERKGFMKARREMTDAARREQGLVTTPGAPQAMAHIQARRLVNMNNVFNDFATNPTVTRPAMSTKEVMLATGDSLVDEMGVSWTKMAGDESLGSLKGMMVRSQEAFEINQMRRVQGGFERTVKELWGGWKFGKTILAPKTHLRNFFSNTIMAHAAGLSPYNLKTYARARREIIDKKGAYWNEAKEAGAGWTVGKGTHLREILQDINPDRHGSLFETIGASLPRFVNSGAKKAARWMAEGYQDSESFFKQALYIHYRNKGVGVTDAIRLADDAIINYAKMPQWVKVARSSPIGVPFLSFTYGATPIIAKQAMENPKIFLHYKMFGDAWNQMAMEAAGATAEEMEQFDLTFPGSMMMVMPFRDAATGSLMAFDVARFTPTSGILPDRVELPGLPALLENVVGQNPLLTEIIKQTTGVDPYFKSQIIPQSVPGAETGAALADLDPDTMQVMFGDVASETNRARAASVARTALPDVLGGGGAQNLIRSLTGERKTFAGDPITPSRAIAELLLGPFRNVDEAQLRALLALEKQEGVATRVARKQASRAP